MRKIMLALVMALAMLAPVGIMSPASAVAGCDSEVQRRIETRGQWESFTVPGNFGPNRIDIRITAQIEYEFCPDGNDVNKLKPKNIKWCWTVSERSIWFDGVNFNAYIFDDNEATNPAEFSLKNPGNDWQRCGTQDIAEFREKWLEMSQSPGHTEQGFIRRIGMPDAAWEFNNPRIKYFHPDEDLAISGWYR